MSLARAMIVGFAVLSLFRSATLAKGAEAGVPPVRVTYCGFSMLPQSVVGRDGTEVAIRGLSGITWLGDDRYAAIMDNGDKLLLFSLPLARDGTPLEPTDLELVTLSEHHDYEDLVVCPPGLQDRITARQLRKGLPDPGQCLLVAEEDTPAVRGVSLADGSVLGVIPTPEMLAARRPNRGFESLAIDADGRHIWTANEEALPADGPAAAASTGTVVRLTRIAIPDPEQRDRPVSLQIAYAVDPPHGFVPVFPGPPLSGVVALASLGADRLLVLERSGCPGLPPFENRLYAVNTRNARDISSTPDKAAERVADHVGKALLWKDQLGSNVEGLCLGPKLGGSRRALLAVADNNGIGTPNQVIGFVLEEAADQMSLPTVAGSAILIALVAIAGLTLYRLWR
jgi:hypothetical protein